MRILTSLCWSTKKKASLDVFELPVNSSSNVSSTPARPRKWKRQPEMWKRMWPSPKWARGESYISPSTGKVVASAKPGPPCKCKRKCYTKFSDDERTKIFSLFWELGDKAVQDAYLHGLIRVKKVGRRRPRKCDSSIPREATYVYVVSNNITSSRTLGV